ncbi:NAD(P)-dependent oxidoreductase [Bacillus sp. NPDC077027]|uniref:NAD(P)-dependent oxidoreductase n=1 Tax=Bacillus sp. NPDC077027 TaxID=3390548 RepID=UPI003D0329E0
MKIALFGGHGRVGQAFLRFVKLDERYLVRSLIRTKREGMLAGSFQVTGNSRMKEDVLATIKGADIVVSCLSTDGDDTLSVSMEHIVQAMQSSGTKRIITIGTAGILQARQSPERFRYETNESRRSTTRAAKEHAKTYQMLKSSDLDWTIICPTYLPDGEVTRSYRYEKDFLPMDGKQISVGDTAHFLYQQLNSKEFLHQRVGIAY